MSVKSGWARCTAALLVLAAWAGPAWGLDLRAKIEPLARPLIEDGEAVGFVVGIVKDGQTQVIAYGETTKGSGQAPDGDTVYEIGSVSKVFTGVLLADAVEQGRMKLDDPVQKFLPEEVKLPIAGDKPITLEHLATHTSGLPRMPANFHPADPTNPYADYTVARMYEFLGGHVLGRPPGEYEYSNLGMGLLGHVLARQAGCTYEELLSGRITKPLAMRDSRITLDDDQRRRLAPPYEASLAGAKNWDIPTLAGAGAIRSTANDLVKFIQANLAEGDQPLTRALRLSRVKRHQMKDGLAMGLGWHIARDGLTRWHSGMTGGYHVWLAVAPELKLGNVVLANTASTKISQFGEQVVQAAAGMDVKPPPRRKTVEVDPAVLASYVGKYALGPDFILTVTLEDGGLHVQATGQPKVPVFAASATEFFYKVVDAQITFVPEKDAKDKAAKAPKLILHQNGRDMEARRQE